MKFVSLFSGVGGFDLGFERAGMRCVAQVEIANAARGVLAYHYPDVQRINDVKEVTRQSIAGTIDLICGGFPCQDVSIAGRRAGLAGTRSGLWFEFIRIVGEFKPGWVVIENTPGLLSSNGGRDFAVILRGLAECGYCVCWRVLDSRYFNVAQRRERVFLVASLGDGRCAQILFERESGTGRLEAGSAAQKNVAATLGAGTPSRRNGGSSPTAGHFVITENPQVVGTLAAAAGRNRGLGLHNETDFLVPTTAATLTAQRPNNFRGNGWNNMIVESTRTFRMRGFGDYETDSVTSPVLARDGKSATDVIVQATGVRRLTPTECERLQGFPDGWTLTNSGKPQSDSARYRQLGNAVTVSVAEWIGRRIVAQLVRNKPGYRE